MMETGCGGAGGAAGEADVPPPLRFAEPPPSNFSRRDISPTEIERNN